MQAAKTMNAFDLIREIKKKYLQEKYFRDNIANFSVALFLNSQFIIRILQVFIPVLNKIGVKVVFLFSAFLMVISIRRIVLNRLHLFIPSIIVCFYFLTAYRFPNQSTVKLIEIVNYTVIPFFLVLTEFNFEKIIKYTLILTSPAILVIDRVFVHYSDATNEVITMVLCHAVLFSINSAIAYVLYYAHFDGKQKVFFYVLCAVNLYYLFELLRFGGRSAVLSVLIFGFIALLFRPDYSKDIITRKNLKRIIIIGAMFALMFIMIVFGKYILLYTYVFLRNHNINARFIIKTYNLYQSADVSNGRMAIYKMAIRGFLEHPIIGNGLDLFLVNTGVSFPHNLFLQFMYDGGLVLLLCVAVPLLISSVTILRTKKYSLFMPWALLFSTTIPVMMVSGDVWIKYVFWFFVAFCLTKGRFIRFE